MPSKVTGPKRQKRYRDRRLANGLKQVTVWVPADRVDELRQVVADWLWKHTTPADAGVEGGPRFDLLDVLNENDRDGGE